MNKSKKEEAVTRETEKDFLTFDKCILMDIRYGCVHIGMAHHTNNNLL